MIQWPCTHNPTQPIPKPFPFPSPCPPIYANDFPRPENPSGLPANEPNPNPGSPNPQFGQNGYHGFPQVPVESFVP